MRRLSLLFAALWVLLPAAAFASGEIKATATASSTVYAVIETTSGTVWNGTSFAAYNDSNWSTYAVALTEQGSSQVYVGSMPSGISSAGRYSVVVFKQAGGSPAVSDTVLAQGALDWSGTALNTLSSHNNTGQTTSTPATVQTYASGEDPASLVLSTPSNKLITDSSGHVFIGGYASGEDPAALVLDVSASTHNTANTIGAKINSAGSAGDPLATTVPGSYASGTVGYDIGNYLNASVSSRSTYAGGDTTGTTTLLSRLGQALSFDANGYPKVDVVDWLGSGALQFPANFNYLVISSGGTANANATQWGGTNVGGMPNSGNVTVGGYATGEDPATLIMAAQIYPGYTFKEVQQLDGEDLWGAVTPTISGNTQTNPFIEPGTSSNVGLTTAVTTQNSTGGKVTSKTSTPGTQQ